MRRSAFFVLVLVLPGAAHAFEFDGRVGIASDHVYRGIRHTQDGPALEGMVNVLWSQGFHAGAWANRVDFERDGRDAETGYFAGIFHRFSPDLALETSIVRYEYWGDSFFDYDYWEWFGSARLGDRWFVTLAVADNWWAADETTHMLEATYQQPLPFGASVDLTLGYNNVSAVLGEDYGHYAIALTKTLRRVTGRITLTGATHHARRILPERVAPEARWVAELSWSF